MKTRFFKTTLFSAAGLGMLLLLPVALAVPRDMRDAALKGTVLDAFRAPIAGVQIELISMDRRGEKVVERFTTRADGTFRFTDLEPGTYFLKGTFDRFQTRMEVVLRPGEFKELTWVFPIGVR